MKVNWFERLWVNGPWRYIAQAREIRVFQTMYPLHRPSRVLEVGCGRGRGARLIAKHFMPHWIDAIDIDPFMIEIARRDQGRIGPGPCEFRVASAEELPYEDSSMEAVFNFGIIHHLEDWERGLREVARVLKPGGSFYFEEMFPALYANVLTRPLFPHPRENRFSGPEYRGALGRVGLHVMKGYRETRFTIVGVSLKNGPAGPGVVVDGHALAVAPQQKE